MSPHQPHRQDRVADALGIMVFLFIALFFIAPAFLQQKDDDTAASSSGPLIDPTLMQQIELLSLSTTASMALPDDVKEKIGLQNQQLATPAGVLDTIKLDLPLPSEPHQRAREGALALLRVALSVIWSEDQMALQTIAELARDEAFYKEWKDELNAFMYLAQGKSDVSIDAATAFLDELSGGSWFSEALELRLLKNAGGDAYTAANEAFIEKSSQKSIRMASFYFLVFVFFFSGFILWFIGPRWIRPKYLKRGIITELPPSPFREDHTRRVLFAWFLSLQVFSLLSSSILAPLSVDEAWALPLTGFLVLLTVLAILRFWGQEEKLSLSALNQALTLSENAPHKAPFYLQLSRLLWGLALCFPIAFFVAMGAQMFNYSLLPIPTEVQLPLQLLEESKSSATFLAVFLGAVVFAPLTEEIIFRGYLYRQLKLRLSKNKAIFLSGLLFGLMHMNLTLLLPLLALGMVLAAIYEWTGRLWVPILVHAAFNAFTLYQASILLF